MPYTHARMLICLTSFLQAISLYDINLQFPFFISIFFYNFFSITTICTFHYTPIATLFLYGLVFLHKGMHYFCNMPLFTTYYIICRANSPNRVVLHHFCWIGTLLSHQYRHYLCMIIIYFLQFYLSVVAMVA